MSFADLVAAVDRVAMSVFGESVPVMYAPEVGEPVPVSGIFDEQYVLAKGGAEAGVSVLAPAVFLRLEDLPTNPEEEDEDELRLTIRSVDYRVTDCKPDGLGGIVLVLRRAS